MNGGGVNAVEDFEKAPSLGREFWLRNGAGGGNIKGQAEGCGGCLRLRKAYISASRFAKPVISA